MKRLIYYCIGYNYDFNKILNISLISLRKHYDDDVMIITDYENSLNLKKLNKMFENVDFMYLDANEKFIAAINRYKIYEYEKYFDYDVILYLDCDTLIINNIDKIFEKTMKNNCIGIVKENDANGNPIFLKNDKFFGSYLFSSEELKTTLKNTIGLNSGVFSLPSNHKSLKIFKDIYNTAIKHRNDSVLSDGKNWGDQPYLNYILIKNDHFDLNNECFIMRYKFLNVFLNNDKDYDNNNFNKYIKDYPIIHFIGPSWGDFNLKYKKMLSSFPKKIYDKLI